MPDEILTLAEVAQLARNKAQAPLAVGTVATPELRPNDLAASLLAASGVPGTG